jgi:hypothetical protein
MVEGLPNASRTVSEAEGRGPLGGRPSFAIPAFIQRHWKATAVATILVLGASWVLGSSSDNSTARASTARASTSRTSAATAPKVATAHSRRITPTASPVVSPVVTTPTTSVVAIPVTASPAPAAPVAPPATPVVVTPAVAAPVAAPVAGSAVAALVSQVEASGIEPGSNWSWSMGDTATHCGAMIGDGTGCTYGSGGLEYSVFAGSPTLALVAHELANAETQNDAVPSLLSQVAAAAGGTTWSPTDGVASCLVAHFMGFQDGVAGTWQCPAVLASTVAADIHDSP